MKFPNGKISSPLLQLMKELPIGSIDMNTKNIHVLNGVDFTCQSTGRCCKQFTIPVTEEEVGRIEDNGYDTFQFIADNSVSIIPTNDGRGMQKVYFLKKKPFTNECVFLEENLCSIHKFKPLACRLYPFHYEVDNNEFRVSIHPMNKCDNVRTTIDSELSSRLIILEVFETVEKALLRK